MIKNATLNRRRFLSALALAFAGPADAREPAGSLATAPIAVGGDWGKAWPASALTVVQRMRDAALADVRLVSDQQPSRIQVNNHTSGPPHIWLHFDDQPVAEIGVDVGLQAWSQLAYQFGHELGHVLANSWKRDAKPALPCQWLEEALVETFSLRGLEHLARTWETNPPFTGDNAYGAAIARYKDNQLRVYVGYAAAQGTLANPRVWFTEKRAVLEATGGLSETCESLIPFLLAEMQPAIRVAELGALNLWPKRSALPLGAYLNVWERRCIEAKLDGHLPRRLRLLLLG